jgi:hypothetical protein
MLSTILWSITIAIVLVVPALILWGWIRWLRDTTARATSSRHSLFGFSFATASALLAIFTHLYARFIHSFPLYDSALTHIYGIGCFLSSAGILFAISGSGRRGPLRWLAPACAFGTLIFWLFAVTSE